MNEKNRTLIMLGVLAVLVIANLVRLGGDSFAPGSLFSDDTDLEAAMSPKARRNAAMLDGLPQLAFPTRRAEAVEQGGGGRNPFIYGVDKRAMEEAKQRMEEMRTKRKEVEEAQAVARAKAAEEMKEDDALRFTGEVLGTLQDARTGKRRISVRVKDEIVIVGEGDALPNKFTVATITAGEVRFRADASGREVTVKLTNKKNGRRL